MCTCPNALHWWNYVERNTVEMKLINNFAQIKQKVNKKCLLSNSICCQLENILLIHSFLYRINLHNIQFIVFVLSTLSQIKRHIEDWKFESEKGERKKPSTLPWMQSKQNFFHCASATLKLLHIRFRDCLNTLYDGLLRAFIMHSILQQKKNWTFNSCMISLSLVRNFSKSFFVCVDCFSLRLLFRVRRAK